MKEDPVSTGLSTRLDKLWSQWVQNRSRVLEATDPEALHDFRVTLRRLRTCLRLSKGCFEPRKSDPILGLLKETADATNALRDQEVLCSILHSLPPLENPSLALQRWLQAQEDLRRGYEKEVRELMVSPAFTKRSGAMETELHLDPSSIPGESDFSVEFKKECKKLRKALRKSLRSGRPERALHKLRVESKRVRYSLEEFDFLVPKKRKKMAAQCKKIQDALGQWRDMDRTLQVLRRSGIRRFPEIEPWLQELRERKKASWKKFKKAIPGLQKSLR